MHRIKVRPVNVAHTRAKTHSMNGEARSRPIMALCMLRLQTSLTLLASKTPSSLSKIAQSGHSRLIHYTFLFMQARCPAVHLASSRWACTAALFMAVCCSAGPASAARDRLPPVSRDPNRCKVEALDKFAETRAVFSQEASSGMEEVCPGSVDAMVPLPTYNKPCKF